MQVRVNQVSKSYTRVRAVDGLSFAVSPGEIFAILGPNGAGKSSTIRMLIGLTKPDEGDIEFNADGVVSAQLDQNDFGYLPEERGLYQDKKILETLVFLAALKGLSAVQATSQAEKWLTLFDLSERKNDQLKTLSKGNQQKVQLISAVIHQPKVVFLDEPFSGLDPVNQEKVIGFLQALRQEGMTIVLSAHQMSLVEKLADRFLLMANGRSALYGTLQDIRNQSALPTRLELSFEREIEQTVLDVEGVAQVRGFDGTAAEIILTEGAGMAGVLKRIMERAPLAGLETRTPTLHDIYLSTVGQGADHE